VEGGRKVFFLFFKKNQGPGVIVPVVTCPWEVEPVYNCVRQVTCHDHTVLQQSTDERL